MTQTLVYQHTIGKSVWKGFVSFELLFDLI